MDQISPKAQAEPQPSMAAMEEGRAEVPGGDPVDGVSLVASLPRRESATDEARPADAVARQSARRNSRTALMDQMAHLAAGREGGAVAPVKKSPRQRLSPRRHGSDGMEGQRARGKVTRGESEVGDFTRAVVVFPVPRLRFSFLQMTTGYRTKARLTGRVARTRSMCAVPTAWCVLVRERGNTRGQPREEQRAPRRSARDERACACRLKACRRSCRSPAPPGPCPCGCASG